MLGYTCVRCKKELHCLLNQVPIIHFINNDRYKGIDVLRFGDIYDCERCGLQVVIGLSSEQILGIDLNDKQKKRILDGQFVEVIREMY